MITIVLVVDRVGRPFTGKTFVIGVYPVVVDAHPASLVQRAILKLIGDHGGIVRPSCPDGELEQITGNIIFKGVTSSRWAEVLGLQRRGRADIHPRSEPFQRKSC